MSKLTERLLVEIQIAAPSPTSQAPPGSDGFLKVLGWAAWAATIAAVLAFLICGAMFLFERSRGDNQSAKAFGYACLGSVIIASAGPLATTFGV